MVAYGRSLQIVFQIISCRHSQMKISTKARSVKTGRFPNHTSSEIFLQIKCFLLDVKKTSKNVNYLRNGEMYMFA